MPCVQISKVSSQHVNGTFGIEMYLFSDRAWLWRLLFREGLADGSLTLLFAFSVLGYMALIHCMGITQFAERICKFSICICDTEILYHIGIGLVFGK